MPWPPSRRNRSNYGDPSHTFPKDFPAQERRNGFPDAVNRQARAARPRRYGTSHVALQAQAAFRILRRRAKPAGFLLQNTRSGCRRSREFIVQQKRDTKRGGRQNGCGAPVFGFQAGRSDARRRAESDRATPAKLCQARRQGGRNHSGISLRHERRAPLRLPPAACGPVAPAAATRHRFPVAGPDGSRVPCGISLP